MGHSKGIIQKITIQGQDLEQLTTQEVDSRHLRHLGVPTIVLRDSDNPDFYRVGAPFALFSNEVPRRTVAYVAGAFAKQSNSPTHLPSHPILKLYTYFIAVQFYQKEKK